MIFYIWNVTVTKPDLLTTAPAPFQDSLCRLGVFFPGLTL